MIILYNKYFPRGTFYAINLLGIVLARKDWGELSERDRNHEYIHTLQQREMLFLPFFLWYVLEWLWLWARCRDRMEAYRNVSFEREAYTMQHDRDYPRRRKPFSWLRYMCGKAG